MMSAKMFMDEQGKIISAKMNSGGFIGLHKHETSAGLQSDIYRR